jgi:lysophospholipase L1-like esterase
LFKYYAEVATSVGWGLVANLATGGDTVAACAADIAAELAALDAAPAPECAMINLGANDVQSMPVEATWKANYLAICDAIHAKWSACKIYLMYPWRRDYDAACDILAGWLTSGIIDQREFVFVGPDERDFLEAGDDGTTYTSDGTHPNTSGRMLTAQQWIDTVL